MVRGRVYFVVPQATTDAYITAFAADGTIAEGVSRTIDKNVTIRLSCKNIMTESPAGAIVNHKRLLNSASYGIITSVPHIKHYGGCSSIG